jgi:hypothetical protein
MRQRNLAVVLGGGGALALLPWMCLAGRPAWGVGAVDIRDTPNYEQVVCHPPIKNPTDTVPPCTEIENIEIMCTPNGTEPLYLQAHAQCMCGGSFFPEWDACQQCLFFHGLRNDQQMVFYSSVITTVSYQLCTGTPTAPFNSIFSSVAAAIPPVTTGATTMSDHAPSQTAISLYYTPSGSLGPGQITGSAAKATNTNGLLTAPPPPPSSSTQSGQAPVRSGGKATTSSSSSLSTNAAAPTQNAGNVLVGVAVAALAAAL